MPSDLRIVSRCDRADLVADDLVDLAVDPAQTSREVPPGLLAQLDAVGEHGRRVGRGELMKATRIARLGRLDAPAAKPMILRSRPVCPTQQPPALRCRQRAVGEQDGHRPRAAGQRRQRPLEEVHALIFQHLIDHDLVDLACCLARHDHARANLAELDPVGDLDHAREHPQAGVADVVNHGFRARRPGAPPPGRPWPARSVRDRPRRRSGPRSDRRTRATLRARGGPPRTLRPTADNPPPTTAARRSPSRLRAVPPKGAARGTTSSSRPSSSIDETTTGAISYPMESI